MATKVAFVVCANCMRLFRALSPQNLRYTSVLEKAGMQRTLCNIATEEKVTTETKKHSSPPPPPSHLLQSKGMGTSVAEIYRPVHPEVADILLRSKPEFVRGNWRKPKISARRLADLRTQYVAKGFYWPEKPMVDRGLDRTPKGHKFQRLKEERLAKIEENMKNMPKIVEEYRKKMRELRAKRRQEKLDAKMRTLEAQRQGINIKDPRALQALKGEKKASNKKKEQNNTKK